MSDRMATAALESLCLLVTDGTHDSPKLQPSGVPFIKGKHISTGVVDFDNCDYITPEDHAIACKRVKPQVDDVLFSNIGSVGDTARVTKQVDFSIKNVALFRPNPDIVDPTYFYYLVKSPGFHSALMNFRSGSAQPFISLANLRRFPATYHTNCCEQRQIAGILSAYDDLIENNTRRIRILEEMAQALYREWFVHFRYPGHEHVPLVDSPAGPIPEGWEAKTVEQCFEILGGGTPSTKVPEYWEDGDITWFSPTDLTASGSMFITESKKQITELGLQKSSARLFPAYSVMMTSRATIGVVAINTQAACTNQGFITCIPNDRISAYQIYYWLLENKEMITSLASGATFKEINRTTFKALDFLMPDLAIVDKYLSAVEPISKLIETLQMKNQSLREARDFLLPRLISGDLLAIGICQEEGVLV